MREKHIQCSEQPSTHAVALGHQFVTVLHKYEWANPRHYGFFLYVLMGRKKQGKQVDEGKRERTSGRVKLSFLLPPH